MSLVETVKHILEGKNEVVTGTNCGNCKFFTGNKVPVLENLNQQGGIASRGADDLALAKKGDLITLPGKEQPIDARECAHPEIKQPVNNRMCCAYWDNPGAYREFKK